jgi:hypothetical protein
MLPARLLDTQLKPPTVPTASGRWLQLRLWRWLRASLPARCGVLVLTLATSAACALSPAVSLLLVAALVQELLCRMRDTSIFEQVSRMLHGTASEPAAAGQGAQAQS